MFIRLILDREMFVGSTHFNRSRYKTQFFVRYSWDRLILHVIQREQLTTFDHTLSHSNERGAMGKGGIPISIRVKNFLGILTIQKCQIGNNAALAKFVEELL